MRIKKGDKIRIIKGKDQGKDGRVLRVLPDREKVVIEGLNLLTKHLKPRREGEKGQRIKFPAPINVSNVMLICPRCAKISRVGYKILEDRKKVRMCKKCKEII